jgi:hypothetical protein
MTELKHKHKAAGKTHFLNEVTMKMFTLVCTNYFLPYLLINEHQDASC